MRTHKPLRPSQFKPRPPKPATNENSRPLKPLPNQAPPLNIPPMRSPNHLIPGPFIPRPLDFPPMRISIPLSPAPCEPRPPPLPPMRKPLPINPALLKPHPVHLPPMRPSMLLSPAPFPSHQSQPVCPFKPRPFPLPPITTPIRPFKPRPFSLRPIPTFIPLSPAPHLPSGTGSDDTRPLPLRGGRGKSHRGHVTSGVTQDEGRGRCWKGRGFRRPRPHRGSFRPRPHQQGPAHLGGDQSRSVGIPAEGADWTAARAGQKLLQ